MFDGITRVALQRSTSGSEGARHIGSQLSGVSGTNTQLILEALKSRLLPKSVEIDFGVTPVYEKSFTITDSSVATTSHLIGMIAHEAPTGKDVDEVEMDPLNLSFAPGSGQFTLYARGLEGRVYGAFKVNYIIG